MVVYNEEPLIHIALQHSAKEMSNIIFGLISSLRLLFGS